MDNFYRGFCNKIIWPLFHYFPSYVVYEEDYWKQYKKVNESFRDAILEIIKPNDIVWVHDYQLMLLPRLLREKVPDIPIGFFLHIPFPSYEVFRLLPDDWRREILEGLLSANLIGFHTQDYTQYFLRCVLRILGREHSMGTFVLEDHVARAATFPMGIDFQKFHRVATSVKVRKKQKEFKQTLANLKIILSVDRLDYTKGIINRLQGFELFLDQNPDWRGRVVLILIVVPSRTGVGHYRQMKRQIEELVGKINGRFSSIDWTPILYQYTSYSFYPLVALYGISDVALITPLRDGMNLISKEYIAAKTDKTGVLVLSEMAGAAKELGEAIIINPNSRQEIADALLLSLTMPREEQVRRNQIMQERLKRYDVVRWAEEFIEQLLSVKNTQQEYTMRLLTGSAMERMLDDFARARSRLIFLDYDGTLVPFATRPEAARPEDRQMALLERLASDPRNEIVIISGRDRETLENWLGTLNVSLVAEHGVWLKKSGDWQLAQPLTAEWKEDIRPLLQLYSDRVPGSFIEEKDYSLAWHYRAADPESGPAQAQELLDTLVDFTANADIQILQGNKVIEVRNTGVNKGSTALRWLSNEYDFIVAFGDDWTDEDLFAVLPQTAYSIKVRFDRSHARFYLRSHNEVLALLEKMAEGS